MKKKLANLLKKAQAGDSASLQLLCEELERYIRGYFRQKIQNNSIVDDLCQETYLRLLENILMIRDEMKLKGFVAKVALHVMQDYFRQKYRKIEGNLETSYKIDATYDNSIQTEVKNDNCILDKVDLEKALEQLPDKTRKILIMKTQGYKYEEISANTGLTVSGVKMQIKRSIEQLREVLFDVTFLFLITTLFMEHIN